MFLPFKKIKKKYLFNSGRKYHSLHVLLLKNLRIYFSNHRNAVSDVQAMQRFNTVRVKT